jgi:hypothetical protein
MRTETQPGSRRVSIPFALFDEACAAFEAEWDAVDPPPTRGLTTWSWGRWRRSATRTGATARTTRRAGGARARGRVPGGRSGEAASRRALGRRAPALPGEPRTHGRAAWAARLRVRRPGGRWAAEGAEGSRRERASPGRQRAGAGRAGGARGVPAAAGYARLGGGPGRAGAGRLGPLALLLRPGGPGGGRAGLGRLRARARPAAAGE